MPKTTPAQIISSAIGICALCFIVTLIVAWMSSGEDFEVTAIVCNLLAVPFAIAVWAGVLEKDSEKKAKAALPWSGWLGVFAISLVVSIVFLWFDCGGRLPVFHPEFVCEGHPGIGLAFTFGAIAMTVIALPSALRAWLLVKLDRTLRQDGGND